MLALGWALLGIASLDARGQCQRAKLTADDGAPQDRFGYSVGVSNDVALVGAPWHDLEYELSGAVYVFERSGADWLQVGAFCLPQGEAVGFGRPIALVGDQGLIGSVGWPRVFQRSGDAWVEVGRLRPDDYESGDGFGESLALGSDVALVGAPRDNDNGSESGSAYVFERDPNGVWTETAKLLASDGYIGDHFGAAVAISGDVIVVGAPDDDDLGFVSGSAYVFERQTDGTWSQVSKLLASDGGTVQRFGVAVAVDGRVTLIGAQDAHGNESYSGAAYVFQRDVVPSWYQRQKLTASDGETSDFFGRSVALSADITVIGAHGDDEAGHNAGAVYVFVCNAGGTWLQVAKLTAEDGGEDDRLGYAVALSGNVAVVGAYLDDDNGEDSGSAYIFAVGPDEDGDGIMDVCLCPGDLDGDYDVDLADLAILLAHYGMTSGAEPEDGDLDGDGDVDLSDLSALLANYGQDCP